MRHKLMGAAAHGYPRTPLAFATYVVLALAEGSLFVRWLNATYHVHLSAGSLLSQYGNTGDGHHSLLKNLFALYVLAAVQVAIAVHECGHVVAGRLAGFRFVRMDIGPLRISRRLDGLHIRFMKRLPFRGEALSLPTDNRETTRRYMRFVAGGTAATVGLFATILLALTAVRGAYADTADNAVLGSETLLVFALLLIAGNIVTNLLPARLAGFTTDGALLAGLWRNRGGEVGPDGLYRVSTADVFEERRPRDWEGTWIDDALAQACPGGAAMPQAHLVGAIRAMDVDDASTASHHIEAALAAREAMEPWRVSALLMEAAYCTARYWDDPGGARNLLGEVRDGTIDLHRWYRAWAAVFAAEERSEEARASVEAALRALRDDFQYGQMKAMEEWLWALVEDRRGLSEAVPG